jgi:hypothetical protein
MAANSYKQWLRYCRLVVAVDGTNTEAIDLSDFRVRFDIAQAVVGKPTTADIYVYNVAPSTVDRILVPTNAVVKAKRLKVILEAGYKDSHATIFQGDLWWKSTGRESEVDSFMRLIAATGDRAHQYAVVNVSLGKGATQADVFNAVARSMAEKGVNASGMPTEVATVSRLPRGKVLYQMSRDAMQGLADTNNFLWGYGTNGFVAIPKASTYDKRKDVIVVNSGTGMIGRPTMTVNGLKVRCLLNPRLDVGSLIQIDNRTIQREGLDTSIEVDIYKRAANTNSMVSADGVYRVISRHFVGDTRGTEWYADLICSGVNASQKPISPSVMNTFPNM